MKRVYLSEHIHPEALRLLQENAVIIDNFNDIEQLDAILLRNVNVSRAMMQRAKNLKVIGKHGVGCDTIDLSTARDLGIKVVYTPTCNTNSVAEMIVGMILCSARHLIYANSQVRRSAVTKIAPVDMTGVEISGKIIGLIGLGNVSRRLSEIMRGGFSMKVVGYDPYVDARQAEVYGITKMETIEDVAAVADIVNISVPLTDKTKNLISGEVFSKFKSSAILVNASRGGIVNEDDLYEALLSKKIYGAASDVFANEPPDASNKLLSLANFCATPHIGGNTEECLYRTGMEIVQQILNVLDGGQPLHPAV